MEEIQSNKNGSTMSTYTEPVPDKIDEDIFNKISKLLQDNKDTETPTLLRPISEAMQAERNHWKHKLNSALQEIDRQHKIILSSQTCLHDLMELLRIPQNIVSKPELIPEDGILLGTPINENTIDNIKHKIRHLQHIAGVSDESDNLERADVARYSEMDLKILKNAIAKLHWEKEALQEKLTEKDQELVWQRNELDTVNNNYRKLQHIVTQYNMTHTGANFHLEMSTDPKEEPEDLSPNLNTPKYNSDTRVRTYVEGNQLYSYPEGKQEVDFFKIRLHSQVYSNKKGNSRTGVAQCLRCNKLFKPSDNNNKSCHFHAKGREIKELYDNNGKITNVIYKWACCRKGIEAVGCSHGYHM